MARMRESDRPPEERVSLLDREPTAPDRAADESTRLFAGLSIVQSRVALRADDSQMLVGRDADDGLYFTIQQSGGGGATGGGTRGELHERGALVMWCGAGRRVFVGAIVADEVTAVRVGDVPAHLQDNAFLAEIGHDDSQVPVITTPEGDREIGPRTP
jgi:hypothetical protein